MVRVSNTAVQSAKSLAEKLNSKKWFFSVGIDMINKEEYLIVYVKSKLTKTIEKSIPKIYNNFLVKLREFGAK